MFRTLSSLVPNAADLLALEVEELAGVLLIHLKSYEGVHGNSVYQNGQISEKNLLDVWEQRARDQEPEYGGRQSQVTAALMEAWAWLEREGFLIRDPRQTGHWSFVSRRGQRVTSREDFEAYRKARMLPKAQLHPLIAVKV